MCMREFLSDKQCYRPRVMTGAEVAAESPVHRPLVVLLALLETAVSVEPIIIGELSVKFACLPIFGLHKGFRFS